MNEKDRIEATARELLRGVEHDLAEGTLSSSAIRRQAKLLIANLEKALPKTDREKFLLVAQMEIDDLKRVVKTYGPYGDLKLRDAPNMTAGEHVRIADALNVLSRQLGALLTSLDGWMTALRSRPVIDADTILQMRRALMDACGLISERAVELRRAVGDWKRSAENRAAGFKA